MISKLFSTKGCVVRRCEVEIQFVPLGEGAGWEQVQSKFTLYSWGGGEGGLVPSHAHKYRIQNIQNTSETYVHKITNVPAFYLALEMEVPEQNHYVPRHVNNMQVH
jgi:hypothetical protein